MTKTAVKEFLRDEYIRQQIGWGKELCDAACKAIDKPVIKEIVECMIVNEVPIEEGWYNILADGKIADVCELAADVFAGTDI